MKIIKKIYLQGENYIFALATIKDKKLLSEGFKKLSSLSAYYRFHSPKMRLSSKELDYFLDIDNYNHLAIGAIIKIKDIESGVAMIRYIRDEKLPHLAEVALAVIDSYQHKGIGTQLYKQLLLHAKHNGIHTLCHYVLDENKNMIRFLKQFDGKCIQEAYGITKIMIKV